MSKRGRTRACAQSDSVWRERARRQAASGQSIAEFCRGEGISAASFYMWRSRHRGRASVAASGVPAKFIDVGPIRELQGAERTLPPGERIELHLDLGGGMVLHLVRQ